MNKLIAFKPLLPLILFLFIHFNCFSQGAGNAIYFDGKGYINCDTSNREITNQVTVEAWVKTSSFNYQWVVGKYDRYNAQRGYHLIIKDGRAAMAGRDGSGTYRISGMSPKYVNDGKWHHLAGVCDGKSWSIYVDGVLESTYNTGYNSTVLTNNAPLVIGNYYLVDNQYFIGEIDEIKIWNKALTIENIRNKMCSTISNVTDNLVGYFPFNNNNFNTVKDHSSKKINGSLINLLASQAWVTSGAPIGDSSVYRYPYKWDSSLELVTNQAKFSVPQVDPSINGMHLYVVKGKPNSINGITSPNDLQEYYGVFKVGDKNGKYKVSVKNHNFNCGMKLYRRENNAIKSWLAVADTTTGSNVYYYNTNNYGEYAATASDVVLLKVNGPSILCEGTSASLNVDYNGNGQINWSTGATTKEIIITTGGKYEVTITEDTCIRTRYIVVQNAAAFNFSLGDDVILCEGDSYSLSAPTGMASYKWSTGATTQSINISKAGSYWVEVTNPTGCVAIDEIKVTVKPKPILMVPQEFVTCYAKPVTLDATIPDATYLWNTGETSPQIKTSVPGEYSVLVTVNDCSTTGKYKVINNECVSIPNIITPNGDGKNDEFVIQGIEPYTFSLEIFNRWGKSIYRQERYDNGWSGHEIPTGMYFYQIKSLRTNKIFNGWLEVIR